jgi:alkylation response protein AidB-like acyl-CoA dehydrogenase
MRARAESLGGERASVVLGELVARWWGMRRLSLSVARMIDTGEAPAVQSALVKEMATRFEQEVLALVQELVAFEPVSDGESLLERLLFEAVLSAPSFTIRGGTNEILRSVAAKGLGQL